MRHEKTRVGEDVNTKAKDDDKFIANIEVALSPNFYAWVFRFGGDMRILSPKKAVNTIVEMAKELVRQETL